METVTTGGMLLFIGIVLLGFLVAYAEDRSFAAYRRDVTVTCF